MNEVTAWETREFAINATTKLVVDVFTMKDQLFANLRKFEVVDANATVSRETDSDLDKICMDFIRHRDNIDHINAISLAPYVTGTAQPKMNQENMNAIWVPLPPLAEQARIVARLEELLPLCERLKEA